MKQLPGDLILLAAIARMYGFTDSAQDLYLLAQLGTDRKLTMSAADMEIGLSLLGLLAARVVGASLDVPLLVSNALADGHAVLAQYRDRLHPRAQWWCALCDGGGESWRGLAVDGDFSPHHVSSDLGSQLTGHFLIITRQLPEWPRRSAQDDPHVN